MGKRQKQRSIFQTVLLPMLLVLLVEAVFLLGSVTISGVVGQLNQNARDILDQQAENRRNYLEQTMVSNWSDLSLLASEINGITQSMLDDGTLTLQSLDGNSEACAPLVLAISDSLISSLYSKRVSSIFVVFNTHDLNQPAEGQARTGIYIRDLDPSSTPSHRNADLLLERAPIDVVRAMRISTDSGWQPLFTYTSAFDDFLYQPFQAAYEAGQVEEAKDFGYWNAKPYQLQGDDRSAVSYSIPLVLKDGTVYGVLGVDLLTEYLRDMLPYEELYEEKQGSYILAMTEDSASYSVILANGTVESSVSQTVELQKTDDGYTTEMDGETYYATVQPLSIYSSNAPFSSQEWALIGMVRQQRLYSFSQKVTNILGLAMLLALTVAIIGCVVVSRRLTKPIRGLSEEVANAQRNRGGFPRLSNTGIAEIDHFAGAITALSRDVVDSSTRFLRIMEMASVELGGFEIRNGEKDVFVTENFFPLLGRTDVDLSLLDAESFKKLLKETHEALEHRVSDDGSTLYRIPLPEGGVRYLRIEVTHEGKRNVGLVEDVTDATLERLRIEHERDYDLLTGLYNRRAFHREARVLFDRPARLKHAAVLMLDLDNLKNVNDRYGHDLGDQYIRQAGQCLASSAPARTLCARISGDEFYLIYYGYDNRMEIQRALTKLREYMQSKTLSLPNGDEMRISASGGVAWYPEDSRDLTELMRYADFAMYQVKQHHRGELAEFDLGVYNREVYLNQHRREFQRLLEEQLVEYHFQPIVCAKDGRIIAYEALMRVNLPTLRSPESVLQLARREKKLHQIEYMTWMRSAEAFLSLMNQGAVEQHTLLFLNSIASEHLTEDEASAFHAKYGALQKQIVVEITEAEHLNLDAIQAKRMFEGCSGLFALDDYGSGYNSEINLLELQPKYVKVDISIIRGIDADLDKQEIVSNLVAYAHERNMEVVAEGIETAAEMTKVLELRVDLLQGYYLARPAPTAGRVSDAAASLLERWRGQTGDLL